MHVYFSRLSCTRYLNEYGWHTSVSSNLTAYFSLSQLTPSCTRVQQEQKSFHLISSLLCVCVLNIEYVEYCAGQKQCKVEQRSFLKHLSLFLFRFEILFFLLHVHCVQFTLMADASNPGCETINANASATVLILLDNKFLLNVIVLRTMAFQRPFNEIRRHWLVNYRYVHVANIQRLPHIVRFMEYFDANAFISIRI